MTLDPKTQRLVILLLGLIVLACVVGGIMLANGGHDLPAAVYALGSSAATALVGVIAVGRSPES